MNDKHWFILHNTARERALRREIGQEVRALLEIIPGDDHNRAKPDSETSQEEEADRQAAAVDVIPTIETVAGREARRRDRHRTRRIAQQ